MKKKVIIINGTGGSGKDTFVEFCAEHIGVKNVSSVDKIKEAALILGWDGKKDEESRKFLSDLKKLAVEYKDCVFRYITDMYNEFMNDRENNIMFVHIREPEEIDKVKAEFDAITLLITNTNIEDITSNESDRRVYEYKYNFVIDNSGSLQDLAEEAFSFVNKMRLMFPCIDKSDIPN